MIIDTLKGIAVLIEYALILFVLILGFVVTVMTMHRHFSIFPW